MADVGQIYGVRAAVGLMWVRSMGQELLWLRSIWQDLLWGRFVSDLWGRRCYGADVGKIYGAGAAVG